MRVFVAGASGAIGTRLVPQLIDAGHEVIGTSRSPGSAERIRALGAKPVALDLLDARAVRKAVLASEPEAIVHEATALANLRDLKHFDRSFAQTNRLRTEGTDALLAAAREAGVRRFVAQSYATMPGTRARAGRSRARTTRSTPRRCRRCARPSPRCAISTRPSRRPAGSRFATAPSTAPPTTGWSSRCASGSSRSSATAAGSGRSIHLDDAAAATVLALEHDGAGIYNIVDDEPAPVREWLPVLAEVLGAKPPRRFPRWLARLLAGEAVVMMGTESRGASNAKAKRELGWELRYPSWRQGFVAAYASTAPAERRGPSVPADGRVAHPLPPCQLSPGRTGSVSPRSSSIRSVDLGGVGRPRSTRPRRTPLRIRSRTRSPPSPRRRCRADRRTEQNQLAGARAWCEGALHKLTGGTGRGWIARTGAADSGLSFSALGG